MNYNLSINIDDHKKRVIRMKDGAAILFSIPAFCQNSPKQIKFDDVFQFTHIFARYTNRLCYFANNYLFEIEKLISSDLHIPEAGKELLLCYGDPIYFEFDAFVTFSKSIVENNIVKRANKLNHKVVEIFNKSAQIHFDNFINPFLNELRDEIVHINEFGSTLQSQISLKNNNNLIEIKMLSIFGAYYDLIEVFGVIFEQMEIIFRDVSSSIISHYIEEWGKLINIDRLMQDKSIDLSYFKIKY